MNPRLKHLLIACILILGAHAAAEAGPIRLAFRNMTVVGGTTFLVPVHVDSSLTGLNVISYQLDISFNSTYLTYDTVITTGSMTESWTYVEGNVPSAGRLLVAGSGATALSDTGRLVFLRFKAKVPASIVGTSISFYAGTTLLNEGGIALSLVNATITVNVPPFITVSPNTAVLTRNDTQQFTVSGGTGPYTWTTTDPAKATINASGLLTATNPGFVQVVAADASAVKDTSGLIEIRGMKLSVRDSSVYQGQILDLSILSTDVTGLGITSGQLTVTFNQSLWTATDVLVAGTILASASPEFSASPGKVSVSFAGISAISGSGTLLKIRLQATTSTYGTSTIGFQNVVFNENLPANTQNGSAGVLQLATVNVTPGGTLSLLKGDSLQFFASSGTAPYTWSVSDSSKAAISSTGVLTVLRGGSVKVTVRDFNGASGTSGTINLYDFRLTVPTYSQLVMTASDTTVELPLLVTANDTGFFAFQFKVTYGTGYYLKLDSILTDGTLATGWNVVPGYSSGNVQIAAATTNAVMSGGTLIRLRFAVPDSTPRPSTTYINLTNVLFNEGAPIPLIENGWLQIRSTNAKPSLSFQTPSSLDSVEAGATQEFSVSSYDPDGDALTYTWKVNGTAEQTGSSSSFSRAFANPTDSINVTVVFQDPWGLKDSASWWFKVYVITGVTEEDPTLPRGFALLQNYPNPFNPSTVISFQLSAISRVRLSVYNILGLEVAVVADGTLPAGTHSFRWDASGFANGTYFYRLQAGEHSQTRKLVLLK